MILGSVVQWPGERHFVNKIQHFDFNFLRRFYKVIDEAHFFIFFARRRQAKAETPFSSFCNFSVSRWREKKNLLYKLGKFYMNNSTINFVKISQLLRLIYVYNWTGRIFQKSVTCPKRIPIYRSCYIALKLRGTFRGTIIIFLPNILLGNIQKVRRKKFVWVDLKIV